MAYTLHKAKIIITEDGCSINNGAILTEGTQIVKIGKWEDFGTHFQKATIDHGTALISPGFINLHAHLLYSNIDLIQTQLGLFTWLEKLTDIAYKMSEQEMKKSLESGINQALASGTTFIVENTPNLLSAEVLSRSPLKALVGLEIFGSNEEKSKDIFSTALKTLNEFEGKYNTNLSFTFSPHAPYDVSLPLWQLLVNWSKKTGRFLLTHLEESQNERIWWQEKRGPALKFWGKINKLEPKLKYWKKYNSGIDFLSKNNLLNANLIATHLTNTTSDELSLLKKNDVKCIHCPRSNFNLNNGTANLQSWQKNNLLFGLGTDSTASSNTLNLIDEIRFTIKEQEKLYGLKIQNKTAFEMLTKNAAQILASENRIGTLRVGLDADLLVFDLNDSPECTYSDPFELIIWRLNTVKDLKEVWINGKRAWLASSILNKI